MVRVGPDHTSLVAGVTTIRHDVVTLSTRSDQAQQRDDPAVSDAAMARASVSKTSKASNPPLAPEFTCS